MKNNSSPANSDCEVDGIGRIAVVTKQVTEAETKLRKNRYAFHCRKSYLLFNGMKRVNLFKGVVFKKHILYLKNTTVFFLLS